MEISSRFRGPVRKARTRYLRQARQRLRASPSHDRFRHRSLAPLVTGRDAHHVSARRRGLQHLDPRRLGAQACWRTPDPVRSSRRRRNVGSRDGKWLAVASQAWHLRVARGGRRVARRDGGARGTGATACSCVLAGWTDAGLTFCAAHRRSHAGLCCSRSGQSADLRAPRAGSSTSPFRGGAMTWTRDGRRLIFSASPHNGGTGVLWQVNAQRRRTAGPNGARVRGHDG